MKFVCEDYRRLGVPGSNKPEVAMNALGLQTIVSSTATEVFILGQTLDGKTFRPSDWAERLAGVMSSFRPGGAHPGSHLNYSPWCIPALINGVKAVVVNSELRECEVMAWNFVLNFAKDNDLQVTEACLLPEGLKR